MPAPRNEAAMPWMFAPIVLALATATASSSTALPTGSGIPLRITYVEGSVATAPDQIASQDGRAEVLFADGSVLHIDRQTRVAFIDRDRVRLIDGRVFVRTTATGVIDIDLSLARV